MASRTVPSDRPPRLGGSLRVPGFKGLFGSSVASSQRAAIPIVWVSWIVYHYTHSALDITYLGLTGIAPGIVLGLFAGAVADRYNRRSLMVTSDLTRMTGMGLLTAALFFFGFSLPLIYSESFLRDGSERQSGPLSRGCNDHCNHSPSCAM